MMLDETRPYGKIRGMCGITGYYQDGHTFNTKKELVSAAPDAEPVTTDAAPEAPAVDAAPAADAAPADVVAPVAAEDLDALHWKVLKQRVEAAGGEWIDKAAAIAFLSQK